MTACADTGLTAEVVLNQARERDVGSAAIEDTCPERQRLFDPDHEEATIIAIRPRGWL
ncbi:MAG: hypothetical protein WA484_02650 [Solirubrobacteraceae bacterium]